MLTSNSFGSGTLKTYIYIKLNLHNTIALWSRYYSFTDKILKSLGKTNRLKSSSTKGYRQELYLDSMTTRLALLSTIDHLSFQKCHRYLGKTEKLRRAPLSKSNPCSHLIWSISHWDFLSWTPNLAMEPHNWFSCLIWECVHTQKVLQQEGSSVTVGYTTNHEVTWKNYPRKSRTCSLTKTEEENE